MALKILLKLEKKIERYFKFNIGYLIIILLYIIEYFNVFFDKINAGLVSIRPCLHLVLKGILDLVQEFLTLH